jgi:cephalosporin-C deacetylase-like acetyl esterase
MRREGLKRFAGYSIILLPLIIFAQTQSPTISELIVTENDPSGIYAIGAVAGWKVSVPDTWVRDGNTVSYELRRNNLEPLQRGVFSQAESTKTIEIEAREPGMLYLEIKAPGGKSLAYGAAIAPEQIRPDEPAPADFDAFWNRKISDLRRIPENPQFKPIDSGNPELQYGQITMDHVHGTKVYGQFATSKKPGKKPAFLMLQWAGGPYPLDKNWIMHRARAGFLALNIEPHNVLPLEPADYYKNLPDELKNYSSINQGDRERNYFVEMYLRGVRAVDWLTKHPDWDGKTVVLYGTSMGGQQSFAVAGLHPKVTHLIVNVPAGGDLNGILNVRQVGYPLFGNTDAKALEVAKYIDTVSFAPRIKAKSLVAMGFVDTVTPPFGIYATLNLIQGRKEAVPMKDSPHNHVATPAQQRPWVERSEAWLAALAKGEEVPVK